MQGFQSDFGPMGAGPSISGKWYNKRTGKTVIVRDSFFMDDGMQVQTSTGEFIDGQEFSRDYIQCGDEVYDESGRITESDSPIDYDALFNTPQQTDVQLELNNTINNIPEEVIEIGAHALCGCSTLQKINIPKTVRKIKTCAFDKLEELKELHIQIIDIEQCEIHEEMFNRSKIFDSCTLYVPSGTRWEYRHHPVFGKFKNIEIEVRK